MYKRKFLHCHARIFKFIDVVWFEVITIPKNFGHFSSIVLHMLIVGEANDM